MSKGLLLLLFLVCIPSLAWSDAAYDAYQKDDYVTAVHLWREQAQQGSANAQFNLGVMYANGRGVKKDEAEAVRWYRKAAEQGHEKAQENLARLTLETERPVRGIVLVRDQAGKQVGLYRQSHALLVGVSDYTAGWPDLESVPGELEQIQRMLRAQGFSIKKVIDPNAEQLKKAFDSFIYDYGFDPDNRLLFYFAGHGYTRLKTKGYLVPADAPDPQKDEKGFLRKSLDMTQIIAWTRRIEAKHALFLFDSCFSGTVFMQRALPERPPHITALTSAPVRQFITAGSAGEEVPAESVFAPAFIDAIEHRLADLDKDGFVTGTELGAHLQAQVSMYKHQTPQFGKHPDYNLNRGDFVFEVGTMPIPTETRSARLTVRSNVTGDTFYVDERGYGPTSPASIELNPGEHRVRVEKDGYVPWQERVVLGPGERRTLHVRLATLPDTPAPTVPAGDTWYEPAPVRNSSLSKWVILVGSFSSENNAMALRNKLRNSGYITQVEKSLVSGKSLYRVILGPYLNRDQAETTNKQLTNKFQLKGMISDWTSAK